MNIPRFRYGFPVMILISFILPVAGIVFFEIFLCGWYWLNEPLHLFVETLGSFVAFFLGLFILLQSENKKKDYYVWVVCGLLGMGIVHGFHGFSPVGNLFVWLYTTGILIGGFFFVLVWLPSSVTQSRWAKPPLILVPIAAIIFCILSMLYSQALPAMVMGKYFTTTAKTITSMGGLFFILAAIYFIRCYQSNKSIESILFSYFCMLNGLGSIFFWFSEPWCGIWWLWHFLRMAAYIAVIFFILIERRQMETRYNTIIQTAIDGFWINDTKGKILEVNEAYCKMIGYSREELLSMTIPDLEVKEKVPETAEHIKKIIAKGYDHFESRHRRKDGRIIDIEVSVNYSQIGQGQFIAFIRDITERKKTEERIQEQGKFLRYVIDSLTHPFYVIDVNDYTIKIANSASGFAGLTKGQTCYNLTHKRDKPCSDEHVCPIEEAKKTKKHVVTEHIHYDKDGNARYVEVHGDPIFDEKGNMVQLIEYSMDITERKKAEKEIQQRLKELEFFREATIEREFRMEEMHREIEELKTKLAERRQA